MKISMNEAEVQRAIQHYLASKMIGTGKDPNDWTVRIRWRGEYAEAEHVRTPVPTLTDAVSPR
jgi:hypothetical protein